MAGRTHAVLAHERLKLTLQADLNSNNSFDSGASLFAGLQQEVSWEAPATAFTTINPHSVSGSTRTVSPKDIFADPFQSAPPSTTFTNITSPDVDQSPFITDSFETSPMFQGDSYMPADNWFSLFPEEDNKGAAPAVTAPLVAPALERTVSSNTTKSSGSSVNSPVVMSANSHRRKSSVNGSPATNASITKPRRRKGPLPTIMVDPNDKVALKRARNTLAARDSRQRKFDHVNLLEKRNAELEAEVEKWKQIALAQGYSGS
ncbi:General control protein [Paraconiothyrium brasiliense]|uniref:General control protein n=1 Tax=Paraconiothyrium brasiliense TaxID=300254 RepID=A0ABR3RTW6_9PLEO